MLFGRNVVINMVISARTTKEPNNPISLSGNAESLGVLTSDKD